MQTGLVEGLSKSDPVFLLHVYRLNSSPYLLAGRIQRLTHTLTDIVAARARYLNEHPGTTLESLVIYVTTQTHASGAKAGKILALRVRAIDVDVVVTTDNMVTVLSVVS